MRYYGKEYQESLRNELVKYADSVDLKKYTTRIEQVDINEDHHFFKTSCMFAAGQAYNQIDSVRSKIRVFKNYITEFYTGADETLDGLIKAAQNVNDVLSEINSTLKSIDDSLNMVGEFNLMTPTSDRLHSIGVDYANCYFTCKNAWNSIMDVQIANNAISDITLNYYIDNVVPFMEDDIELLAEDIKHADPIIACYFEKVKAGNIVDDLTVSRIYKYYVHNRKDAKFVSETALQNCIDAYELLHSVDGNNFDEFLKPAYENGKDDVLLQAKRIKYTVYTAAPQYRDVVLHYLPEVALVLLDPGSCAYYSSSKLVDGKTTLNLTLEKEDSGDSSFCHEFGHALDNLTAEDTKKVNYTSDSFRDSILSECRKSIKSRIDMCSNLSYPQKAQLLEYFFTRENVNVSLENDPNYFRTLLPKTWSPEMKDAYEKIRAYYGYEEYVYLENNDSVYKTNENNGLTSRFGSEIIIGDILGGATNNKVGGMGTHRLDQKGLMSDGKTPISSELVKNASDLHDCLREFNYWYDSDTDEAPGELNSHFTTEFFAENFDYHMRDSDLTSVHQVFDGSCKLFDKTYAKIVEDVFKSKYK